MSPTRRSLLAALGAGGLAGVRDPIRSWPEPAAPPLGPGAASTAALPAIDAERIARRVVDSLRP